MKRSIGIIAISFALMPIFTHAQVGADSAADAQCIPITTTQCGCGLDYNAQTKSCEQGKNKYQCICSQTDAGRVTTGTCQADSICHAIATDGKTPEKPSQQVQSGTGAPSGQPGAPEVSPNTKTGVVDGTVPQQSIPSNPTAGPSSLPVPGQSVFQDALQQLQQLSGGSGGQNQFDAAQSALQQETGVPLWLSNSQQQLQQMAPADTGGSSPSNSYGGDFPVQGNGSFNPASQGLGSLGPSPSEVTAANEQVTQTPFERAMEDVQTAVDKSLDAAKGVEDWLAAKTGTWVDTATKYFDQNSSGNQSAGEGDTVQATIYYPGCVGAPAGCDISMEGGLYGSHSNYLNPQVPTVAAGPGSGYQYGQVLNITNPNTGQSVNAVVGDVCPGCGSGIDLNPKAAAEAGFTQDVGRADMQVSVVGNTSGYTAGAQLATSLNSNPGALDPWSASPGQLASGNLTSPSTGNWASSISGYTQLASVEQSPQAMSDAGAPVVENGPAYPSGNVTSESFPEVAQATNAGGSGTRSWFGDQSSSIESQVPTPTQEQTNPQQSIEQTIAQENAANENAQLQARLEQATIETNNFDNPVMPPVNTSLPSGQALTQQIYDSAIATADRNVPVPTAVEGGIPTQAQLQGELLTQGQSFSALDANQFYYNVQGNQLAEAGPAVPAGSVENGAPLAEPGPANPSGSVEVGPALPEPGPANPSGTVETGPAIEQPNPAGVVEKGPELGQPYPVGTVTEGPKLEQPLQNPEVSKAAEADQLLQRQNQAGADELVLSKETALSEPQMGFIKGSVFQNVGAFGGVTPLEAVPTGEVTSGGPLPPAQENPASAVSTSQESGSTLAEVSNGERTFTAFDTGTGELPNGTNISSELFSPDALKTGAGTGLTSEFKSGSADATLAANSPQPTTGFESYARASQDVTTDYTKAIEQCGGTCEFNNAGASVEKIQQFLVQEGYNIKVDGIYGSQTRNAVQDFQQDYQIAVDGIVGPQTATKMNEIAQQSVAVPATQNPVFDTGTTPFNSYGLQNGGTGEGSTVLSVANNYIQSLASPLPNSTSPDANATNPATGGENGTGNENPFGCSVGEPCSAAPLPPEKQAAAPEQSPEDIQAQKDAALAAQKQQAQNDLVKRTVTASAGLEELRKGSSGDTSLMKAGQVAANKIYSDAQKLGDEKLTGLTSQYLSTQHNLAATYNSYQNGNWGAIPKLITLQAVAISQGSAVINYINQHYR